jgi:hypothetical protein
MGQIMTPAQSTVEERKEKLVEKLSTQYSLNHISMEEYERFIKYSQDIETEKELKIFEKIIKEHDAPEIKDSSKNDNKRTLAGMNINNFTLLSSRKTTGPITGGNFVTILGDHKILIDEEDLIKDKTVLNVMVLLGDMVIHVPENVNVVVKAFPLLADIKVPDALNNKACQKKLVIRGNVILGDIRVKVRK